MFALQRCPLIFIITSIKFICIKMDRSCQLSWLSSQFTSTILLCESYSYLYVKFSSEQASFVSASYAHRCAVKSDISSSFYAKTFLRDIFSVDTAVELSKKIANNQTFPTSHYGPFLSTGKTKGTANVVVLGTNGDLVSVIRYLCQLSPFHVYSCYVRGIIRLFVNNRLLLLWGRTFLCRDECRCPLNFKLHF